MNWYSYCDGNPVDRIDPNGENWITDKLTNTVDSAKNVFNEVTGYVNELQKSVQRDFWNKGSQIILRDFYGYETSAWMLEHSLNDNPADISRENDSRIANLINDDNAYLTSLDNALRTAENGVINQDLEGVVFNNGDLYYSIHKSTIHIEGNEQDDGTWLINATLTDTYDFTEIQSFMSDSGLSTEAGLGTLANDFAVISQNTGAINSYKITVNFNTKRRIE